MEEWLHPSDTVLNFK